ncbi:MAG: hypothetical protein H7325_08040, partial [Pedobacter sp.]|nr:hypothetical protein [Pedobacter sp.]
MEINLGHLENTETDVEWRLSSQPILPVKIKDQRVDEYDMYPYHSLDRGKIFDGYKSLAEWIIKQKIVVIDGYSGVFWNDIKYYLDIEFKKKMISVNWLNMSDYLKTSSEIQHMISPFIGTLNSVWGTKCNVCLSEFYNINDSIQPENGYEINIAIGVGSALLHWNAPIIYLDLPKNELQFRMRAGSITNLGNNISESASEMYKRFYFVDWVILNEHKKNVFDKMSVIADTQWKDSVHWVLAKDLKAGLNKIAKSVFRVRPWFDRGAWGGQWMKDRIKGLNKDEINYAWSFELIVPENGIVFESEGNLLEVSFDFLMFSENDAVLGKHAEIFGYDFPIRFDFLDTWDGGNLSIQCHPCLSYIQDHFGENITQDETYYILDCQEKANVYLGFQEDINPAKFRNELENSRDNGSKVEIAKYVQSHHSQKHDLFLIPNSTIHSAGAGNMVLEISATPYIFTF